jgi:hypothetical protein
MAKARSLLLVLLLLVAPACEFASGAEWSVWDRFTPSASTAVSPPGAPPIKGLELPLSLPLGRGWVPDLAQPAGRLQYIGQMHWAAELCLERNDQHFAETDLNELERLWEANATGLSSEELWRVHYGVMHHRQGGGSAISNASCADAKAWLLQDRPNLAPAK